jgi:hypothetical protein
MIGTWQLWERSYPAQFSMVVVLASIVVPLTVSSSLGASPGQLSRVPAAAKGWLGEAKPASVGRKLDCVNFPTMRPT